MRCKKGFIFSIIAISFMLLLMYLAVAMANEYWETERVVARPQPLSYATSVLENIGKQFADIVLPFGTVTSGNESVRVWVADSVPRPGIGSKLNSMKAYAENDLADSLHADISVNISNVDDGSIEMKMLDGFIYDNSLNGTQEVLFRPIANTSSTGATDYWVDVSVNEYRNKVTEFGWDPGGAMNVTVRYTDKNGTVELFGPLDPDEDNTLRITYGVNETEWIELKMGRIQPGTSQYDGSLFINMSNTTSASFSFAADLPLQPSDTSNLMVFPIPMNYSQGGVYKEMNASR